MRGVKLVILVLVGIALLFCAFFIWASSDHATRQLMSKRSPDGRYEAVAAVDTYGGLLSDSYYSVTLYQLPKRPPLLRIFGGIGGGPHEIVWTANEGIQLNITWLGNSHLSISCSACAAAKLKEKPWRGVVVSYVPKPL